MPRKYKQGLFTPKNPKKYHGDLSKLKFKSWYERCAFQTCDQTPQILLWAYEPSDVTIPYYSKLEQKHRTYHPDLLIRQINNKQELETLLIEIKPYSQTIPPKKGRRKKPETFMQETLDYNVNLNKWESAHEFAKKNNIRFVVVTEYELGLTTKKKPK
jgi:hypothetical protein